MQQACETGTFALTYNWEGTLPEANDPAKSQGRAEHQDRSAARQRRMSKAPA